MRVVAIIQARVGSTRLPGKVLKDIGGQTMLARVVRRTQQAASLDEVVVATSFSATDVPIVTESTRLDVPVFRGDEEDVLDRFYQAAQIHNAQAVVRITSDCPLIDPSVIDKVVYAFMTTKPDYACNTLERTYPRGLDTEIMSLNAFGRAWRGATDAYQRVHVTPYLYQNPHLFRLLSVTNPQDYSSYRWTVDTLEDLVFVREVYQRLGNDNRVGWQTVLRLLQRYPALVELNRRIQQKDLHDG
jgi:spore coat polysaccharide biosynthesis protein SpsF